MTPADQTRNDAALLKDEGDMLLRNVRRLEKRTERLETTLRDAIITIEHLAEQQAMPDPWWEAKVADYRKVLKATR